MAHRMIILCNFAPAVPIAETFATEATAAGAVMDKMFCTIMGVMLDTSKYLQGVLWVEGRQQDQEAVTLYQPCCIKRLAGHHSYAYTQHTLRLAMQLCKCHSCPMQRLGKSTTDAENSILPRLVDDCRALCTCRTTEVRKQRARLPVGVDLRDRQCSVQAARHKL